MASTSTFPERLREGCGGGGSPWSGSRARHREEDDDNLLRWAIDNGLVFVTEDHGFEGMHKVDQDHLGIVVIGSTAPIGHVVEWLELIARAVAPDEMRGQIIYIPRNP